MKKVNMWLFTAMAVCVSTSVSAQSLGTIKYPTTAKRVTYAVPLGVSAKAASAAQSVAASNDQPQMGSPEQQYRALMARLPQQINSPNYNYALGIAALDSGHTVEAIQAFERTLAMDPGNLPARAEIARAYLKAGDIDTAKRELELVKAQPNVPQQVRNTMIDVINGINAINSGGGTLVSGFVEAGGGYDSNVNTATSDSTMVIPLFAGLGTARLSDSARETPSGFTRETAQVNVSHGINRQVRLFGGLTGNATQYYSAHDFDQIDVTGRFGANYLLADRSILTADITAQHSMLDNDAYRWLVGPSVSYEREIATNWRAGAFAQAFAIQYPSLHDRDGYRYTIGAGASRAIPSMWGGGVNFSGYLGTETVAANALEHLAYDFAGIRLGLDANPISDLTNFATFSVEGRDYGQDDPLFLDTRQDLQLDATLGTIYRITGQWSLRGQLGYTHNDSNIALYEYNRWNASAFARYGF